MKRVERGHNPQQQARLQQFKTTSALLTATDLTGHEVIRRNPNHFLTINPAVCTCLIESNPMTLIFAWGNSLLQELIASTTSRALLAPNIGSLYIDQYPH